VRSVTSIREIVRETVWLSAPHTIISFVLISSEVVYLLDKLPVSAKLAFFAHILPGLLINNVGLLKRYDSSFSNIAVISCTLVLFIYFF
jgi:hypothetical protein